MKKWIFAYLVCLLFPLAAVPFRPIPWLTTGSIEFLEQYFLENKNPKVLEFGSGSSTVWFAQRTKNLTSIEHNENWHDIVKKKLSEMDNTTVNLILKERPYDSICSQFSTETFDLILVDGRDRIRCIKAAIHLLKPGGVMMLDNSNRARYKEAYRLMKPWKCTKAKQDGKDACGFRLPGWTTTWWIKPK